MAGLSDASSPHAVGLMIQLAVGDFYRMDYDGMRGWRERALAATEPLSELPLTAASRAILAVAAAFMGAIPEGETHRSEAAGLVDALPDDELGRRLDALADLSTAELYLHRYAGTAAARALAAAAAADGIGARVDAAVARTLARRALARALERAGRASADGRSVRSG
jgi:hypothetical protein